MPRKPLAPITDYTVGGFDIEADAQTADPYLICADLSNGKQFKKTLTDAYDVLSFLSQPSFQHTINGFWNISYDSEGMLRFFPDWVKYLLTKNPECYLTQNLDIGTKKNWYFHLKLIPKKAFFIRTLISPINRYFDFAQFYDKEPLKKVAKRLLNDDKQDFDASKSSLHEYFHNPQYQSLVQEYCMHDASLTRRIGEHLVKAVHQFLPTTNFTSRASIAEQYFLRNGYSIPPQMRFFFKPFLKTYRGGRFEMLKAGFIPNTHTSDFKSAYPAQIAKMPILTKDFEAIQVKDDQHDKKALYGAYKIDLQVPLDDYMGPIPHDPLTNNGPIIYPVGYLTEQWIDKITLEYLISRGYDLQISEGIELFDSNAKCLLEKPILDLFSIKENKKNDEGIRNSAKIIMNSGYGKTIQFMDDIIGEILTQEQALENGYLIEAILENGVFAYKHTGVFKVGSMNCPPYASFITAGTRVNILEACEKVTFENVVAIQTDSLTTINKRFPDEKGLGGLEYKGRKDLKIGKPGFYQFDDSGDPEMDPVWKIFNQITETKARSYARISDITQSQYNVKRRISMKQSAQRGDFTQQNIIKEVPIQNNITGDQKRNWNAQLNFDDLRAWGRCIDSTPIIISKIS